jgi:hypothetical protein
MLTDSLTTDDPKAGRSPRVALPGAEGQAHRRCTLAKKQTAAAPAADSQPGYSIGKYGRNWYVPDPAGELVCLTVYKRGAEEVVRRLAG